MYATLEMVAIISQDGSNARGVHIKIMFLHQEGEIVRYFGHDYTIMHDLDPLLPKSELGKQLKSIIKIAHRLGKQTRCHDLKRLVMREIGEYCIEFVKARGVLRRKLQGRKIVLPGEL